MYLVFACRWNMWWVVCNSIDFNAHFLFSIQLLFVSYPSCIVAFSIEWLYDWYCLGLISDPRWLGNSDPRRCYLLGRIDQRLRIFIILDCYLSTKTTVFQNNHCFCPCNIDVRSSSGHFLCPTIVTPHTSLCRLFKHNLTVCEAVSELMLDNLRFRTFLLRKTESDTIDDTFQP